MAVDSLLALCGGGALRGCGAEEPLLFEMELDPQSAAFSFGDVDRVAVSGADLVEHGLACAAESFAASLSLRNRRGCRA